MDSRYARIMQVTRATEQQKPRMCRLGDQLGAGYTPLALLVAGAAGYLPPIGSAIGQELIDLLAVLNAVRVALPTADLQDF